MAVELGLNRYIPIPPAGESEYQKLERRNRERTYLVLFGIPGTKEEDRSVRKML